MFEDLYNINPNAIKQVHTQVKDHLKKLESTVGPKHDEVRRFKYYEQDLREKVQQLEGD
jgi:hypothetical protein